MVSLPQRLSASPSAVRNHRAAAQRARHPVLVNDSSARPTPGAALPALGRRGTPPPAAARSAPRPCGACSQAAAGGTAWQTARPGWHTPHPAVAATSAHRQTRPDGAAGAPRPGPGIEQVAPSTLPLIVGGPGDRPRPSGACLRGQRAFTVGSLVRSVAKAAADGDVPAGKLAELLADRAQHLLVAGAQPEPGADAGTGGCSHDQRRGDRTHVLILAGFA